jgi:hypothetical protein
MKKITRTSVPRRVVLPLAAAAFLAACDEHPPSTSKTINLVPSKPRADAPERVRASGARTFEQRAASKIKTTAIPRTNARVHQVS